MQNDTFPPYLSLASTTTWTDSAVPAPEPRELELPCSAISEGSGSVGKKQVRDRSIVARTPTSTEYMAVRLVGSKAAHRLHTKSVTRKPKLLLLLF